MRGALQFVQLRDGLRGRDTGLHTEKRFEGLEDEFGEQGKDDQGLDG